MEAHAVEHTTEQEVSPETIGRKTSEKISVELSTRFLEHFSEQLYSSPQKAFEELISNGWDAGANFVDVRISPDLASPGATMCVLDNGVSMDAEGLRGLWRIAFSPKKNMPIQHGRQVIGQFGIGKLATYVLANKLTYICKAEDGIIRRVTMDFGALDQQRSPADQSQDDTSNKLIKDLELDLFEVEEAEVARALTNVHDGTTILDLIRSGSSLSAAALGDSEFGGDRSELSRPTSHTWTLVVLSGIKSAGTELRIGVLKRMLEAALPLGSEMAIRLNGEALNSSKLQLPTLVEWIIGPDLGIESIELIEDLPQPEIDDDKIEKSEPAKMITVPLSSGNDPYPHIDIPGIGRVTGCVRLFVDRISGGKSDARGASNGFHVNVLRRVVNQQDPSFGEKDLSHAAWARFRMAVRADGLNTFLTTDREKFRERQQLKLFRSFLRKIFNKARAFYDNDQNAGLPDGGDVLVRSLGVLSLSPLRNVVAEVLGKPETDVAVPGLFDDQGVQDREAKRKSWHENTAENIKNALDQVKYERLEDEEFVKFRIVDNTIIVNPNHPFSLEHSRTKAEKELVRTIAMVNFLSDVYALDIGVQPAILDSIRKYRDQLMRYRALQRRQSGVYIAKLLLQTQHESDNSDLFEAVLSDALRYLGFQVRDLAKSGEPEGIASAYPLPAQSNPTKENPNPPLYSFSFDAKSSKHASASTGNIKLDGVVQHRNKFKADHALVVAPGFTGPAINERCAQQKVTPMSARDLGRLLEYTVQFGAIPVTKMREIFQIYDHVAVSAWVDGLETWLRQQRTLTIDIFLRALDNLKGKVPDALPASMIAFECRERLSAVSVKDVDVIALVQGLSILIPDLVGISGDKITVNASAERIAASVTSQLDKLHSTDEAGREETPDAAN
jgi:hypothetical protein